MEMIQVLRSIRDRVHGVMCRLKFEVGQTTAEYALVLLAAAAVAVLLITWAKTSGAMEGFFAGIISKLTAEANSV